ncbi:MAG TPA: phage holin family protein [Pyrinomonadaceae bacterium]
MQPRMKDNQRMSERPLGELFSDLASETSNLVRQEVALAKSELSDKFARVGKNVGSLVIGGAIAYAAVLAILASVIILLADIMPAWLSALIVGLIVAGVAWLLISKALTALQKTELTPRQTVETLKEDAQWIKEQVK